MIKRKKRKKPTKRFTSKDFPEELNQLLNDSVFWSDEDEDDVFSVVLAKGFPSTDSDETDPKARRLK